MNISRISVLQTNIKSWPARAIATKGLIYFIKKICTKLVPGTVKLKQNENQDYYYSFARISFNRSFG